jgi:hypothetical protein
MTPNTPAIRKNDAKTMRATVYVIKGVSSVAARFFVRYSGSGF